MLRAASATNRSENPPLAADGVGTTTKLTSEPSTARSWSAVADSPARLAAISSPSPGS
jgi:hypothetical protein